MAQGDPFEMEFEFSEIESMFLISLTRNQALPACSRIGVMVGIEYSKHVSHSLNSEKGGCWDICFLS